MKQLLPAISQPFFGSKPYLEDISVPENSSRIIYCWQKARVDAAAQTNPGQHMVPGRHSMPCPKQRLVRCGSLKEIKSVREFRSAIESPLGSGPQLGSTQLPSGQPPTVSPVARTVMPDPSVFIMYRSMLPGSMRLLAKTILVPSGEYEGNTSTAPSGGKLTW